MARHARCQHSTGESDMAKTLTNSELRALIPAGSEVYYCRTSRGICVVQTSDASEVIAILSGSEAVATARRARLIACIPLLLDAIDKELLDKVVALVGREPAEDELRLTWPPPEWKKPSQSATES